MSLFSTLLKLFFLINLNSERLLTIWRRSLGFSIAHEIKKSWNQRRIGKKKCIYCTLSFFPNSKHVLETMIFYDFFKTKFWLHYNTCSCSSVTTRWFCIPEVLRSSPTEFFSSFFGFCSNFCLPWGLGVRVLVKKGHFSAAFSSHPTTPRATLEHPWTPLG